MTGASGKENQAGDAVAPDKTLNRHEPEPGLSEKPGKEEFVSENGDPPSGNVKILTGAGIALVVFGGAFGAAYLAGYVRVGSGGTFQPTGDPPVTVSDGSLHAKDVNGWDNLATYTNSAQLIALTKSGNTGTIVAGKTCGVNDGKNPPTYLAAAFWATDQNTGEIPPTEIKPGSKIIIHHDPNNAKKDGKGNPQDQIIITVPPGPRAGKLTIDTSDAAASDGVFFGEDPTADSTNGSHNRRHSRPGNVSSIVVQDSNGSAYITWPASGKLSNQAHFSLGFCFQ
jgi:hypothetical protein